jgi:hypothetical protein
MTDRRGAERPKPSDRRGFPRPSPWLNLSLTALAFAALCLAARQRREIDARYARLYSASSGPSDLGQVRAELAEMEVTREVLRKELGSRLAYLDSVKSRDFYLSIDTAKKKLSLNYGNDAVRDADVRIGAPAVVKEPNGKTWTFAALKGDFTVVGKETGLPWVVPTWVYARDHRPIPSARPAVAGGLGKYVVLLPNGYVIHSPPSSASPLKGPKPGSFMVSEADLQAIWDRITPETRVYIF